MGQVTLLPGDLLLLFTDGVTEAMTREGEEFGLKRLQGLLHNAGVMPATALMDTIIHTTQLFFGSTNYQDDYTLMIVSRQ